jgi:hypothetical protein
VREGGFRAFLRRPERRAETTLTELAEKSETPTLQFADTNRNVDTGAAIALLPVQESAIPRVIRGLELGR